MESCLKSFLLFTLLAFPGNHDVIARVTRATSLTLELLIVVDFSAFEIWYQKTSNPNSHLARVTEAEYNVKRYVSALIHSSNSVYASLQSQGINIQLKLVEVLVMATKADSPWTETVKTASGSTYHVDPDDALPLFQTESEYLQATVPHDHAMIFTGYQLEKGSGGTFSGYAYNKAECKPKSVSIVFDEQDPYAASLIAHEIGHSLGCNHDGDRNSCDSNGGYVMTADFILANPKKWQFSSCSVDAINTYLQNLNTQHTNCLDTIDNSRPDSQIITESHEWYGQVYDTDAQCKITYGENSYFCRNQYDNDYDTMCLKFYCYDPVKDGCYYHDGGDGTPCGPGKWCMANECVTSSHVNSSVMDSCAAGDQPGVVYNGHTCQEIRASHTAECSHHSVMRRCCQSCANYTPFTTSTDIDGQCVKKVGSGSYLCRGATRYDNKTFSDIVCSDMMCNDPSRSNWCLSKTAEDQTSCGYKKWCQNGVCVHDDTAPAVSDTCPWGNQPGIAEYGLTCDQIGQPDHLWRCYDEHTGKLCCATCQAAYTNITGCEYGDKSDWCADNIPSAGDKRMCYYGHNADLCCGSCNNYRNTLHKDCPFGDKRTGCRASRCSTYSASHRAECCETCQSGALIG